MQRRSLLKLGGGIVSLGALAYWQRNPLLRFVLTSRTNETVPTLATAAGGDVCVLLPVQTAGPYYFRSEIRSAIREDRPGLPLALAIEVVKMPNCDPVEGALVEIWHCDAAGGYSGYGSVIARAPFDTAVAVAAAGGADAHIPPTNDTTFLRGGQITGNQGRVAFETIFPGWYDPRVTHIHLKVSREGQSYLTTQLYFPDELTGEIYKAHPDYAPHGLCPYNLTNDLVLGELSGGTGVILQAVRQPDRIDATLRVGIA